MQLHLILDVEDGLTAVVALRNLAGAIQARDGDKHDAVERKTISSGIYQLAVPEVSEIDIY